MLSLNDPGHSSVRYNHLIDDVHELSDLQPVSCLHVVEHTVSTSTAGHQLRHNAAGLDQLIDGPASQLVSMSEQNHLVI